MPYLYEVSSKKFNPKAKSYNNIKGKKILAFSPHSDDLSIGAGGFLSYLAKNNSITPVLAYEGHRGVVGKVTEKQATEIREKEMILEAKVLKIEEPIFLKLKTYLKVNLKTKNEDREKIRKLIRSQNPQIIFLPNPQDLHPRHKLLTKLVKDILVDENWSGEIFFYEIPWSVFSSNEYNFIVPLTQETFKRKIDGIKVHKSQLKRTNFVRLTKALLSLRAGVVPEEKIGGYGAEKIDLGNWVEVYKYKAFNCATCSASDLSKKI